MVVEAGPSFLMCPEAGRCGEPRQAYWVRDPADLAGRIEVAAQAELAVREAGGRADAGGFFLALLPERFRTAFEEAVENWQEESPEVAGAAVTLADVAEFMKGLLRTNPFSSGDAGPAANYRQPWVDLAAGRGAVVAVTQRHLAFVAANVLMGNGLEDSLGEPLADGLSAALAGCAARAEGSPGFVYGLLSFLAVLSKELSAPGAHGSFLVAATPREGSLARADEAAQTMLRAGGGPPLPPPRLCEGEAAALAQGKLVVSPRSKTLDLRGFDSSRCLITWHRRLKAFEEHVQAAVSHFVEPFVGYGYGQSTNY